MNKQHARIEKFIIDNGSITDKEANKHLGVGSFSKRISEMRRLGYPLSYIWERGENKYGEPTRYKRWFLKEN